MLPAMRGYVIAGLAALVVLGTALAVIETNQEADDEFEASDEQPAAKRAGRRDRPGRRRRGGDREHGEGGLEARVAQLEREMATMRRQLVMSRRGGPVSNDDDREPSEVLDTNGILPARSS